MNQLKSEELERALVFPIIAYDTLPNGFPKNAGVYYYNKDWVGLYTEYLGTSDARVTGPLKEFITGMQRMAAMEAPGKEWIPLTTEEEFTQEDYLEFREMTERAMNREQPTRDDLKAFKDSFQAHAYIDDKGIPIVYAETFKDISSLLSQWVYYVWRGKIVVRKCHAADCDQIYIPTRSDQEYCSKRCVKRMWARHNK